MKKNRLIAGMIAGLCFISLCVSCNSSKKNNNDGRRRERYSITPNVYTEGIKKSQYSIDSICSLNIPDEIIEIGIDKIIVVNGKIFILDTDITKKLYIFDFEGNLINIIGERGKARDEFIGKPDEFFVDSKAKLHVFDKIGQKIIVFNDDGSVDKVIETHDFFPHSIGLTSNDKYMMSFMVGHKNGNNKKESSSSLILLDHDCKNYKQLMSSDRDLFCCISDHTFFQDQEGLAYIPCFSDSVIIFKQDTIDKVVSFDFGGKILCKEMSEKLEQSENYSFMSDYQGVMGIKRYQETSSLVYIDYIYNHHGVFWLYNKENGQTINGSEIFEGINPYSYYFLDGKRIIAYIDDKIVEGFKQFYNNNAFQENLNKSPEQMRDLMEGRIKVPALFYITLK